MDLYPAEVEQDLVNAGNLAKAKPVVAVKKKPAAVKKKPARAV